MSFITRWLTSWGLLRRRATILIVGLDGSGKSTLLQYLKDPSTSDDEHEGNGTVPTIGFSVDQFVTGQVEFTVFDMSGQDKYRSLWENYYTDAQAVIFVCDSSDSIRMGVARDELHQMLQHRDVRDREIPLLIFANKSDVEGALTAAECSDSLGLEVIKDRPWNIFACCALTGQGVQQGIDWFIDQLKQSQHQQHSSR